MKKCLLRPACLLSILLFTMLLVFSRLGYAAVGDRLSRITEASDTNRNSTQAVVSPDGTKIAFVSDSDFLNQGIPDDQSEIWMFDQITQALTRITNASDTNRDSFGPRFNADGTKLVFASDSDFFNEGIADEQDEIWVYDLPSMALSRITIASNSDRSSFAPAISGDGNLIAFTSDSDFLSQSIPNDRNEVWLYNVNTASYTRVTVTTQADRTSGDTQMSADGTKIVFVSDADFLNQGIAQNQPEIWMYNVSGSSLTRVTNGSGSDRWSLQPTISADGTKIAFASDSDFLSEGIPSDQFEIWSYDVSSSMLSRITSASGSPPAPIIDSWNPTYNDDGDYLIFESSSDLSGQNQNLSPEIWLYQTSSMTFSRLTNASDLTRDSHTPSISDDGLKVVFHSDSDFFNEGIPDGQAEIWLIDRAVSVTVDQNSGGTISYMDPNGNETSITIPTNAVTETTTLSFNPLNFIDPPAGLTNTNHAFALEAYRDGILQNNFQFESPITIQISYDDADIDGLDEDQIVFLYFNGSQWSNSGITVIDHDKSTNLLTVTSDHLSDFAMFSAPSLSEKVFLPIVLR